MHDQDPRLITAEQRDSRTVVWLLFTYYSDGFSIQMWTPHLEGPIKLKQINIDDIRSMMLDGDPNQFYLWVEEEARQAVLEYNPDQDLARYPLWCASIRPPLEIDRVDITWNTASQPGVYMGSVVLDFGEEGKQTFVVMSSRQNYFDDVTRILRRSGLRPSAVAHHNSPTAWEE